jgi:FAD:protein FMN transferase
MIKTASWRALGTGVRLVTHDGRPGRARAAVADLLELVDLTYSRFRPDSELSRLNARSGQSVPASGLLLHAVETALRGARLSEGLVDPTVGGAMRLIGYDADFAVVERRPDDVNPFVRFEPIPGWQTVRVDLHARTIRTDPGVELDLGSTGKALAADLAAAAARFAMGQGGVLVSLGGDIAVAGDPPEGGWRVLAAEDHAAPDDPAGEMVTLTEGGLATSSTTVRRWTRAGIGLHHLVDPRTGRPADGPWRTASVAAASCVDANIAATAAILLGERAEAWLAERDLPSRLVRHDGVIARVAGWPAPVETRLTDGSERPAEVPA